MGCGRRRGRAVAGATTLLFVAVVVVVGIGSAAPAWAHAVLVRSDPAAGATLDASPERVTLGFSEPVSAADDAIRVIDTSGTRVDAGDATSAASSAEVGVGIGSELARGTYVVSWRVVSSDSHPISGAFAFGVGVAPAADAAAAVTAEDAGSTAVGAAAGVARFVAFAGAVLLGSGFFLFVLWPAGLGSRRARRLVWAGWGASAAAAVALLFLQGLYTSGLGLADIASAAPLSATLADRFGHLIVIRLLALALAVPLLRAAFRETEGALGSAPAPTPTPTPTPMAGAPMAGAAGPPGVDGERAAPPAAPGHGCDGHAGDGHGNLRGRVELGVLGVVVAVTLGMIGHAGAGNLSWLASTSLTVHVAAMAVWLGGLAVLTLCLLWPAGGGHVGTAAVPEGRVAELGRVLPQWSRTAMVAVFLVVLTGLFQSWREVGELPALVATDYGRLLLYKLLIFVVMLGAAAWARRWIVRRLRQRIVVHALSSVDTSAAPAAPKPPPQAGPGEFVALRRGVFFEVVLGAAVLAVSAALVNTIPARTSYSPSFSETAFAGPLTVDVQVEPTTRGLQTLHVYTYDPFGRVAPLKEAKAQFSLPEAGIGPFDVPLTQPAPGHLTAGGIEVPLPGTWQLRLTLRISDFDQYVTTVFYEVR